MTGRGPHRRVRARGLLAGALLALVAASCGRGAAAAVSGSQGPGTLAVAPKSTQSFGPVPDFSLVDQRGRTVTLADLRGHPWVMAAIYSRCTGPCPAISARMEDLQRRLEGTDVRLVSVSVDPDYDSSAVLSAYAAKWDADPDRWLFLTGPEEAVQHLVRDGFWMAIDPKADATVPVGQSVTHDTRLVAVDRNGLRRGWYDQGDPAEVGRLLARMRYLAEEGAQ